MGRLHTRCAESLTAREILDSFPDEYVKYGPKAINQLKKELKPWFDSVRQIEYQVWPTHWKVIAIGYLDMTKPKDKFSRLQKMQALEGLMRNDTASPISEIDIGRAKQVPCQQLVELKKLKETHYKVIGCCPFHEDSTPSFFIYKKTNSWVCFSCRKGGDSIRLIMDLNGMRFTDAVTHILGRIS